MTKIIEDTIIEQVPEDWEEVVFSDVVEINPKRVVEKGTVAKHVAMEDLKPFQKKISNYRLKEFKGGSKFKNGDTLLARITPSLENGKTSFVDILDEGEIGFGSTEFIVMSAKEEKTIPNFVYYLCRTPQVRNIAINSMTGTSGRQRVDNAVFDNIIISLPFDINEQAIISKILSDLDSKIEINQNMNKTLEEICQSIFKYWFVDFEFPNEDEKPYRFSGGKFIKSELGKIPENWKIGKLGDFAEILNGFAFKSEDYVADGVFLLRTSDFAKTEYVIKNEIIFLPKNFYKKYENFQLRQFDILLVMVGASVGSMGFVTSHVLPSLQNQNMWNIRSKNPKFQLFLKHIVKKIVKENIGSASGSARDFFRKDYFKTINFVQPSGKILHNFNDIVLPIYLKIDQNIKEIETLSEIRDLLLPKLMSGQIRVPLVKV